MPPIFIQNLVISLYGIKWKNWSFGGIFPQELKKFKDREQYTKQQWRDYQTTELRKLLLHAFETVPFYQEKYSKAGFRAADFRKFELEDLKKLPCLEKEEFRKYGTTTLLSHKRKKNGPFFTSSGTTGTPIYILYTPSFHQRTTACYEARIRHWAGVNSLQRKGIFGRSRIFPVTSAPFHRYNAIGKEAYFSPFHLSPDNLVHYLNAIRKHKLEYLSGMAMGNYFLAKMLLEEKMTAPPLKSVITTSEKLTHEMRITIQQAFGCKAFDSYSGAENCGLISETPEGELLFSPDSGILEIMNEHQQEVNPGESGEVVSTGLMNFDQPLIRYRIGDTVTLSPNQSAACGREMPIIQEINGRVEDVITGRDGRQSIASAIFFFAIKGLVLAQTVQEDIGVFTINLMVDDTFNKSSEAVIANRMASHLGELSVTFNYLGEIPRNAGGKFQAVVSKLKRQQRTADGNII